MTSKQEQPQQEQAQREEPHKVISTNLPGEPGRTPGSAEGDRETVEESIRLHEEKERRKQAGTK
ncbi:MAG: hypothetical protein U0Z53_08180 [Blastocatellia bacterium]